MMRKKATVSLIALFVCALAGLSVYSTYAYLTAQGAAHNVITFGTVSVALHNGGEDKDCRVLPGDTETRSFTVENVGESECYVRVRVQPTATDAGGQPIELTNIAVTQEGTAWRYVPEDGCYYAPKSLAAGDKSDPLALKISFPAELDNTMQGASVDLAIAAQAVQSANNGFEPETGNVTETLGWPDWVG